MNGFINKIFSTILDIKPNQSFVLYKTNRNSTDLNIKRTVTFTLYRER